MTDVKDQDGNPAVEGFPFFALQAFAHDVLDHVESSMSAENLRQVGRKAALQCGLPFVEGIDPSDSRTAWLDAELAYLLLAASVYGYPRLEEPVEHDESITVPEDTPFFSTAFVRGVLELMPDLESWLQYLNRYPEGSACALFRTRRAEMVKVYSLDLHPDEELLASIAGGASDSLSRSLLRSARNHLFGPVVCMRCRARMDRLTGRTGSTPATVAAVAADSGGLREFVLGDILIPPESQDRRVSLRFAEDGLHLWYRLLAEESGAAPEIGLCIEFHFKDGSVLEHTFVHPKDSYLGSHAGPLEGRRPEDIEQIRIRFVREEG
jgi:hypothetical protein